MTEEIMPKHILHKKDADPEGNGTSMWSLDRFDCLCYELNNKKKFNLYYDTIK